MKITTVLFDKNNAPRFPLYYQYDGQYQPQNAYIELDLNNGNVDADYSAILGAGIPEDVFNEKKIWFYVKPDLTNIQISIILKNLKSDLDHLYNVSDIIWNGQNFVGGASDESAITDQEWRDLVDDLKYKFSVACSEYNNNIINANDFDDWFFSDTLVKGDAVVIASDLIDGQGDDYYFDDSINDVVSISCLIRELWLNNIELITANEAKQLLEYELIDKNDEEILNALKR